MQKTCVVFCTPLSKTSPFLVRGPEQYSVPGSLDNCPAQLAVQQSILSGKGKKGRGEWRGVRDENNMRNRFRPSIHQNEQCLPSMVVLLMVEGKIGHIACQPVSEIRGQGSNKITQGIVGEVTQCEAGGMEELTL